MGAAAGSGGMGAGSTDTSPQSATGTVPSGMRSQLSGMMGRMRDSQTPPPPTRTAPQLDRFGNQGQFGSKDITQYVRDRMGDYTGMQQRMAETGVSEADIGRAAGVAPGNVYSYMNRPDYKQYGPNGQFYQPIYRSSYGQYPGPSQPYSPGYGPFGGYGGGGLPMMGNPFGYGGGADGGMPPLPARGFGFNVPSYMFAEGGDVDSEDDGIAGLLK